MPARPKAVILSFPSLMIPNPPRPNQGRSPLPEDPLVSLADSDFVYIRNTTAMAERSSSTSGMVRLGGIDDGSLGSNSMRTVLEKFRNRLDIGEKGIRSFAKMTQATRLPTGLYREPDYDLKGGAGH